MKYELDVLEDINVLKLLEPRMIYECLDPIQEKFIELVESGKNKILIDFSGVEYVDSFAVGFIMEMYRRISTHEGVFKICGLQPRVKKILKITRVDNVVDIYRDIEEALAAFGA